METFSALLAICEGIHRSPLDYRDEGFLWSASQQTFEQTLETPVIWGAIALIMTMINNKNDDDDDDNKNHNNNNIISTTTTTTTTISTTTTTIITNHNNDKYIAYLRHCMIATV